VETRRRREGTAGPFHPSENAAEYCGISLSLSLLEKTKPNPCADFSAAAAALLLLLLLLK